MTEFLVNAGVTIGLIYVAIALLVVALAGPRPTRTTRPMATRRRSGKA